MFNWFIKNPGLYVLSGLCVYWCIEKFPSCMLIWNRLLFGTLEYLNIICVHYAAGSSWLTNFSNIICKKYCMYIIYVLLYQGIEQKKQKKRERTKEPSFSSMENNLVKSNLSTLMVVLCGQTTKVWIAFCTAKYRPFSPFLV